MTTKVYIVFSKSVGGQIVTELKKFDDEYKAAKWLTEDSYFLNADVRSFSWIRGDEYHG